MPTPQPNSQHCFVCGLANPLGLKLRFYQTAPGEIVSTMVLSDEYQSYPGVVHGGIIAAMLDEAGSRSQMINDPDRQGRFMFTANMHIRYRKNVPTGQELKLVGKAGTSKCRTAQARGEIYGPEGDLLAEAELVLVDIPDTYTQSAELELTGWKVYPE